MVYIVESRMVVYHAARLCGRNILKLAGEVVVHALAGGLAQLTMSDSSRK